MKLLLLWLMLALMAVAAPASVPSYRYIGIGKSVHTGNNSDWRDRAIQLLQKAIDCLEGAVTQLPEDLTLLPGLNKALDYLRKKLADLQDSSISFSEVNRFGFLRKIIEKIDNAVTKLPGGPLKDRLQHIAGGIRELIDSLRPSDIMVVNETVRNRLNNIQQLIESHKHYGNQFLLKFLNSELLEGLVSQIPKPMQSEVRNQIAELMKRVAASVSIRSVNN